MYRKSASALATCFLFAVSSASIAKPLADEELNSRLQIFGKGFLLGKIDGPVITDPKNWIGRASGNYVYHFTEGSDDGNEVQTEQHIPNPQDPESSWERRIGDQMIETYTTSEAKDVLIVEEVDEKHGYRVEIKPGIHWAANIKPGDDWEVNAALAVYEVPSNKLYKDGKIASTMTYEGAFRIHTPAGDFDTVLIREDFLMHIGPLKADDDRFMFFAKNIGLVAEIEGLKASAMIVVHIKQDSAKVLQSYPASP